MGNRIIQVPMDTDLVAALDTLSQETGSPRAEVIRKARKAYLKRLEAARPNREYADAYRRIPATAEELA